MLLIDASKVESIEVLSTNELKLIRKDYNDGYYVTKSPIRVKVAKDLLYVVKPYNHNGELRLRVEPLNSTSRKFQDVYSKQEFRKVAKLDETKRVLSFCNLPVL